MELYPTYIEKWWLQTYTAQCTGCPVIHGRVIPAPCEKLLVQCTRVQYRTLDKTLFYSTRITRPCLFCRVVQYNEQHK